ncbi:MAG: AP2 domain-containing protein [Alcaligenaceae bacterium]|nr:MAG: AP2 domain-containing protein [Alcaligenaceae bacterium]
MPRGKRNPAGFYAIYRTRYAWDVCLSREKVSWNRRFTFSAYGSEELALEAARVWRDQLVLLHPPKSRQERATQLTSANVSGVAGVTAQYGRDGLPKLWLAKTFIGPNKVLRKAFGVARYGQAARGLAQEERARQLLLMTGLVKVHPAEAVVRAAADPLKAMPIAKELPKPERVRSNNRSGTSGVVRRKGHAGHPGYWTAQSIFGVTWVSRSFSIKTYGDDGAKALATAERKLQILRKSTSSFCASAGSALDHAARSSTGGS